MNDELRRRLRKLGLRVRPRTEPSPPGKPGKIEFDPRGDAVYQWQDSTLIDDGEDGERARLKALQYHGLSLVEDDLPADAPMRINAKGSRLGYNPYESGLLTKKPRRRKKDLRELSKWIEVKRKLARKEGD